MKIVRFGKQQYVVESDFHYSKDSEFYQAVLHESCLGHVHDRYVYSREGIARCEFAPDSDIIGMVQKLNILADFSGV